MAKHRKKFHPHVPSQIPVETLPLASAFDAPSPLPDEMESETCHYRLVTRLGGGGYGSVYLAEATPKKGSFDIPRQVAIKVYHTHIPDEVLGQVRREIAALRAINHPRIPGLYDWILAQEQSFVAMQYFDRGTIATNDGAPIKIETGWRLLNDVLEALVVAHRASILHLDIKPSNILIDEDGGFVLADFGISQALLAPWDIVKPGLGTFGYNSPEQAARQGKELDTRTDLYGVGTTLWSLLTGISLTNPLERPQGASPNALLPRLKEYRKDVPDALDQIVMSLLAEDPAFRPGSAAETLAWVKKCRKEEGLKGLNPPCGSVPDSAEAREVCTSIMDPIWSQLAKTTEMQLCLRKFSPGEVLGREHEEGYRAFVLLRGKIRISREGEILTTETREGTILGEIATLAGLKRTATMTAEDTVWVFALNAAELESMAASTPSLAVSLLKTMAERIAREVKQS